VCASWADVLKMGLVYLEGIKRLLDIPNRVLRVIFYIYFN